MNTDQKYRWGGLLENPLISKIQRNILDGGRNRGLRKVLDDYSFQSVIDIGCGLGETSEVFSCPYKGIDNSTSRIEYAAKRYPSREFAVADARELSFTDNSFDTGIIIDTSHHLSDEIFAKTLNEMSRIVSRYIIVSDPVYFEKQNRLSRFFYSLDRGGCFRTKEQMLKILESIPNVQLKKFDYFTTFPGLYKHIVFILKKVTDTFF